MKFWLRCILVLLILTATAMPSYCLDRRDGLLAGAGSFVFNHAGSNLKVWYYNPGIKPDMRVVFVMHGVKRNGSEYRDSWAEFARNENFLLLVPELDAISYPAQQYSQGNMYTKDGQPVQYSEWAFTVIETIFDHIKASANLKTEKYSLYGHSAGAQFVHRFVLFCHDARLDKAFAANAGWYTVPDFQVLFPYGLLGTNLNSALLSRAFSKNLVVMLGAADIDPDHKYLSKSPSAIIQGSNRLKRGENFYNLAMSAAEKLETPFNWKLIVVDGAGHSNSKMSKEAVKKLIVD